MRIAVASEGLEVASHAGHCASFMCYTVERGIIAECQNFPNPSLPGVSTASLLKDLGVDVLITGGIDMDTANALCYAGIEVVARATGSVRSVAESYLAHTLIGTDNLCHMLIHENEDAEAEDEELDNTFGRIEREMESATRA